MLVSLLCTVINIFFLSTWNRNNVTIVYMYVIAITVTPIGDTDVPLVSLRQLIIDAFIVLYHLEGQLQSSALLRVKETAHSSLCLDLKDIMGNLNVLFWCLLLNVTAGNEYTVLKINCDLKSGCILMPCYVGPWLGFAFFIYVGLYHELSCLDHVALAIANIRLISLVWVNALIKIKFYIAICCEYFWVTTQLLSCLSVKLILPMWLYKPTVWVLLIIKWELTVYCWIPLYMFQIFASSFSTSCSHLSRCCFASQIPA